ncbi:MAG: FHA domain-containing protein [Chloroflexi bacterium]|nr:FHA domain-containing protein [Chloroflexota bacterium]
MKSNNNKKLLGPDDHAWLILNKQVNKVTTTLTQIGRDLDNDIILLDLTVSRQHAQLRVEDDKFIFYNLSSNGRTEVNFKQVDKCEITHGDIIHISNHVIVFYSEKPNIETIAGMDTASLEEAQDLLFLSVLKESLPR